MKKIITLILFCFFLLPITADAESLNYRDRQNHYSFILPSGWIEIPKSTIDDVMQRMANQTSGQLINYDAAFQLKNTPVFQYPYFTIKGYKIDTPSYNQITKAFEKYKLSEIADKEFGKYSGLISNGNFQDISMDNERNIIFMNAESEVINFGKVKLLSTIFLGKQSITQLSFVSLESEYSENLSTFNQIIDSFKYEQGYQYDAKEAKKNDSPSIFEGVTEKSISGAISGIFIALIGGFIILIFRFFSNSNKKKDKK